MNNSEDEEGQEAIRIYATEEMLNILEDKNYNHFFLDGTFKCVPKGKKNAIHIKIKLFQLMALFILCQERKRAIKSRILN